ncbi:complement factor H [Salmo salar]|uniref:Complement factor H n=1 Tax=Salmo salar TaxID=8030 RepID=A0ABM3CBB1_SALSA|nr:complement factor H-like [Salmo salar]
MFYSFHFYCIYHLINMKSSLTLLCLVVWLNVDASSAQTEIEGACINPPVMNGFIVQSNERNVDPRKRKIYYSCNVGFKPSTGGWWGEATCTEGTWSGILECIAQGIICDPPPKVENAIVEIPYQNKYIEGFEVNYECRKSFEIEGLKKLTCENGNWTTPPPTCKPSCPDPPSIENGDFIKEKRDDKGVITELYYQCSRQYTLSFTGSIRCQNGKWPSPPKCLRPCEISTFDAEYNLQNLSKKDYTTHNEKKTLQCKEGYYHIYRLFVWNIVEIEVKCDDGEMQYEDHKPICSHLYS